MLVRRLLSIAFVCVVWMAVATCRADLLVSAEFQATDDTGLLRTAADQSGDESLAVAASSAFSSTGTTWNHLEITQYNGSLTTNPSWSGLVDRNNATTTVGFSITGSVYAWNQNNFTNAVTADDFFFAAAGASSTFNWSITGLTAGTTYKLFLYGSNLTSDRQINQLVDTNGDGSLTDETAVGVWSGSLFTVKANSSGTILGYGSVPGGEGNWSGFQIAQVPEPSVVVLLLTCASGLLAYAWRKQK
jgi:hypothetical protein